MKTFFAGSLLAAFVVTLTACDNDSQHNAVSNHSTQVKTEATSSVTLQKVSATDAKQPQQTQMQISRTTAEILAHGEEAHKNHCYKCHTDTIYTRDDRFVKSIDALSKQVVRCKNGSDVPWFDEDAEAVVQFLNQKYYKF